MAMMQKHISCRVLLFAISAAQASPMLWSCIEKGLKSDAGRLLLVIQ